MVRVALIVGLIAGYAISASIVGAAIGALGLAAGVFAAQAVIGRRSMRRGQEEVPIDMGAPDLDAASLAGAYETLPLAHRNAIIAREVARASGHPLEQVAGALFALMGRNQFENLTTERAKASISADVNPSRVDRERVSAICSGEVNLAAQACLPPNDRIRAVVEQKFGMAVDRRMMADSIVQSRLPMIDATVLVLIGDAMNGQRNLAFVVGTIRKVGEYHTREMAKIA